ncbi:MAG: tRNA (adenine-N1)-methyltransferase [Leptospirillum sp.]
MFSPIVSWGKPAYNPPMPFLAGESLILYDNRGRAYVIPELIPGKVFNLDGHLFPHAELMEKACEGESYVGPRGLTLTPFRPTLRETLSHMKRRTQVIYPKDQGLILMWGEIRPGLRILESGIGAGALTLSLLRMSAPGGEVVSLEKREEHASEAMSNLRRMVPELMGNHKLLIGSYGDPGWEDSVPGVFDRVVLDLPEPWEGLSGLAKKLRPGGILVSWMPTPLQVHTLSNRLKDSGDFHLVQTVEAIVRDWEFGPTSVRPAHRIVGHTGYLTMARRAAPGIPYIAWEPSF